MGGQLLAEGLDTNDIALLEHAVVLRVLLHCIVRQMHVNLVELLARQVVLFARRAHVRFSEHIQLSIVANQGPDADIKLALAEEQRRFDVLLHDERAVLNLLHAFLRSFALFKLVLRYLTGQLLDLFVSCFLCCCLLAFGRWR